MNNPLNAINNLYKFQEQILAVSRNVDTGFYLTGGTAVARGFVSHRYSNDLELRVNDASRFGLWVEMVVERLRREVQWQIQTLHQEERFCSLAISQNDLRLSVTMLNDGPLHIGSFTSHPLLGRLDSPENILANKVMSLLAHPEPNDLADVWGLCITKGVSLQAIITNPSSKAAGVFVPDVARVLCTATKEDWKMVAWIQPPPADQYLAQLNSLGESLLLTQPASARPPAAVEQTPRPVTSASAADAPVRQLRGAGLLNYSAAIKAAAQNSVPSSPPSVLPASTEPGMNQPPVGGSRFLTSSNPEGRFGSRPLDGNTLEPLEGRATAELRVRARRKIAYYLPVYLASSAVVLGHLADISETGFRIDCKNTIQVGQELKLRLDLPAEMGRKPALIFSAFCRWCQPDYIEPLLFNAGFEVGRISQDDVLTYKQVIEKYSARMRNW